MNATEDSRIVRNPDGTEFHGRVIEAARPPGPLALELEQCVPGLIAAGGPRAVRAYVEFFVSRIRNPNTRAAYARACGRFLDWCGALGLTLSDLEPIVVASYIEAHPGAAPTVKQHLAAIRMLFDWLVLAQVLPSNPAAPVRGPKHVVKKGKTPVLTAGEARALLDAIDTSHVVGLRDRALIGVMVYSFARVGALVAMRVEDYRIVGRRASFRLHEKGGKEHEVPAHHNAEAYVDAYLQAAGIREATGTPLWRSVAGRTRTLTEHALGRRDVLRMVGRRARDAGISGALSCHTFRATGITAYLENGGTLEHAQAIAGHESPRTTKLYDRTNDQITLDEIERILI